MRTLEIFAGTQSFSKGITVSGGETVTVDILDKFKPDIVADIMSWDYKSAYPVGHFDIIWASPPCTEYSKAKTRGERDLDGADALVRKSIEIIRYFQPKRWIIENVGTGLLVKRMATICPEIADKAYIADYCAYGKPYRKRTIFWSNVKLQLKLCGGKGVCASMTGSVHKGSCGNGTEKYNKEGINSVWDKDSIPEPLITSIIRQMSKPIKTSCSMCKTPGYGIYDGIILCHKHKLSSGYCDDCSKKECECDEV